MKKFLAVLLAALMTLSMFSVAFVAMAEDVQPPEEETTAAEETDEGGFSLEDLEDLPFWQVKGAAKALKIVVKIVLKIAKVLIKLGIVDTQDIVDFVTTLIGNVGGEEETTEAGEIPEVPEATIAA